MQALAAQHPLPAATRRKARANRTADGRIRVGFYALSNIFATQAVLRPILRHLDRRVFDARMVLIENGAGVVTEDSFTELFDEVVVIERCGVRDAAIRLAEMGCDILIDLNGMQQPATFVGALAWRPAPVQLSWTGRPITCALPELDYNVVDEVLAGDGTGCQSGTLRLPNAFACFGTMPEFDLPDALPSETTGGLTFGVNAEPAKFNLRTIDMWAAVLQRSPGRIAFLRPEYKSGYLRENIRAAFAARGIDPARVEFWTDSPAEERGHMRLYDHVDVLLDGYPMSGGIGVMEALHMGVPAVTLEGPAIQLRVGASHLHAAGLDDLRTATIEAYAETAVALARDVPRRRRLRRALRERLRHSAFVDPEAFARDFNATLKTLAERRFGIDRLAQTSQTEGRVMADDKQATIDGVAYNWADLSEQARTQLAHLRATDQEIQCLRTQLGIAQTARRSYISAIKAELPDRGSDST
jgi:predicted O-linked N-acetylglucosamine transferase (SPINDLY family)